jgi:hypothetical protein
MPPPLIRYWTGSRHASIAMRRGAALDGKKRRQPSVLRISQFHSGLMKPLIFLLR